MLLKNGLKSKSVELTLEEMNEINKVQTGILAEINSVCEKLGITYFMVHGSLLGTIRSESFIPYDDDIDIAMRREDYDRFLAEAQKLIDKNYFVQSYLSDKNYPLEFAKVRDNRTTYIVDKVRDVDMNHGIYVDVFPIDYTVTGKLKKIYGKLLSLRVGCIYKPEKKSKALIIKQIISRIVCPSVKSAVRKRDMLAKSAAKSDKVTMTGGKAIEKNMPLQWFEKTEIRNFENLKVFVPAEYDKYLTHIYGDYKTRTLVEGKMADEKKVKINAYIADAKKPYTHYMNK